MVTKSVSVPEFRYRDFVNDLTETVCRFEPNGNFTYVNEVFCRMFGKEPKDLIGKRWHPVAHPDDVSYIEAKLGEMSAENPVVVIENRVYDANDELRWMQFINRGIYSTDGKLIDIQSVGRDITSLKKAQERLDLALSGSGFLGA